MLCLLFLGLAKFTPEEAQGIQPLIAHCHLMAWMYSVWSLQGDVIGTVELCFGRAAGALYLVDAGLTSRGSELRNNICANGKLYSFHPRCVSVHPWFSSTGRSRAVPDKRCGPLGCLYEHRGPGAGCTNSAVMIAAW